MTCLPDWLVERVALDELAPANRARIDRVDPRELAERIAAVQAANTAELTAHPARIAVDQIDARVAAAIRDRSRQRRRRVGVTLLGVAAAVVTAMTVGFGVEPPPPGAQIAGNHGAAELEPTRVKGRPRLLAFRQTGDQPERLDQDALVHAGDVIQLRYNGGGQRFGVIASLDGAGVVTLHYPLDEQAPAEATALAPEITALPNAYALDDAPRFERFFFITGDEPVDVQRSLDALRDLARRTDSATGALELASKLRQSSLRLRKPDGDSSTHKVPTP
ncbi:MAG: hypothetical protein AB7O24_00205 [Kofleriaceae bacterium]